MPHLRKRHLIELLSKSLKYSPIVGIFGHRQVGKTTIASGLANTYTTLDVGTNLQNAEIDPAGFISSDAKLPFAIDECQLAPKLFPALKEHVRVNKRPGQFLLTGSVRFSSRKAIRESLTGRLIAWDLIPMDLSEIHQAPLPKSINRILSSKTIDINLPASPYFSEREYFRYLKHGGLPGVFAVRDPGILQQRFETQLNTILERDLKLILPTTLGYRQLRNLATRLAAKSGYPLELSALSRETRISVPTLRRLISAFEAIYLIRVIPTEGNQRKPVVFFEDVGEANYLAHLELNVLQALTAFLFANLRTQIHYHPEDEVEIFQYRNRGGGLIPLCFRKGKDVLGVIPSLEQTPTDSSLGSARSFLKTYKNSKVVIVHIGRTDRCLSPRLRVIGAAQLV